MKIKSKQFIGSFPKVDLCPVLTLPEFAFIGRSNVGKSSLLNAMLNDKNMAKVSSTPGKTKLINLFNISEQVIFADLPGFGYAKVSKTEREAFDKMMKHYFIKRQNLQLVFLLVDIRIPPQAIDISFCNWFGEHQIPFNIVFTKCDKVGANEITKNASLFSKELKKSWSALPEIFYTSSEKRNGVDELWNQIQHILEAMKK